MRWVSAILLACYVNLLIAPDVLAAKSTASKKSAKSKATSSTFLDVTATVPSASVFLDDQPLGETPIRNRPVQANKSITITVRKLGFLEFKQKLNIKAGENTKVNADLLPFAGVIHVTSNHTGAQVAVDGKVVGTAPIDYEVKLGTRQITVTISGYPPFQQAIRANPGETYDLRAAFGNKAGQIAALPLEIEGGDWRSSGKADNFSLLPLEAPPRDPELALEPMTQPNLVPSLVPPNGVGTGGMGEVPLEGLTLGDPAEPALSPLTVNASYGRPKPWYREWWPYAVAGGVVAAVVIGVVVAKSGGGPQEIVPNAVWSPELPR